MTAAAQTEGRRIRSKGEQLVDLVKGMTLDQMEEAGAYLQKHLPSGCQHVLAGIYRAEQAGSSTTPESIH